MPMCNARMYCFYLFSLDYCRDLFCYASMRRSGQCDALLNIPRVCDLSCLIEPLTSSSLDEGIRTQPCFLTITFSTVYLDSRMDNLKCNRLTCRKVVSEKAVVVRLLGVRYQLMAEAIYCRQHVRQLVVLSKSRLTIR